MHSRRNWMRPAISITGGVTLLLEASQTVLPVYNAFSASASEENTGRIVENPEMSNTSRTV